MRYLAIYAVLNAASIGMAVLSPSPMSWTAAGAVAGVTFMGSVILWIGRP